MLRINQEKPLFQLGRDFRAGKFFAASDIGGLSKISKISIIQVLEGLVWDLEVWIESAIARQSILTLLAIAFESLQSHWPTLERFGRAFIVSVHSRTSSVLPKRAWFSFGELVTISIWSGYGKERSEQSFQLEKWYQKILDQVSPECLESK